MKKRNTMSLLFFIKKSKLLKNGEAPIYMRISVNSKRVELAVQISVDPEKWSSDTGMAKQNSKESRDINKFLDAIKVKLHDDYRQLIDKREEITAVSLKNAFLGIKTNEKTLVSVFLIHNEEIRALVGIDYSPTSLKRYQTCLKQLQLYMVKRYKMEDIAIIKIDYEFVTNSLCQLYSFS